MAKMRIVIFNFLWMPPLQIGSFEHNLTTDLLNHLVFLQRVFMKEVNEVIQKVSGMWPSDYVVMLIGVLLWTLQLIAD